MRLQRRRLGKVAKCGDSSPMCVIVANPHAHNFNPYITRALPVFTSPLPFALCHCISPTTSTPIPSDRTCILLPSAGHAPGAIEPAGNQGAGGNAGPQHQAADPGVYFVDTSLSLHSWAYIISEWVLQCEQRDQSFPRQLPARHGPSRHEWMVPRRIQSK